MILVNSTVLQVSARNKEVSSRDKHVSGNTIIRSLCIKFHYKCASFFEFTLARTSTSAGLSRIWVATIVGALVHNLSNSSAGQLSLGALRGVLR
jgi:hypothetical protein